MNETSLGRVWQLRRRPRVRLLGLGALALAVAATAWFVTGLVRSGDTEEFSVEPVAPVGLSAQGLRTLAASVGQPIYWAGPRDGYLYELTRNTNGDVFIRYLPPGVKVGATEASYLVIATYPYEDAYEALRNLAGGEQIELPRGGVALVDAKSPTNVHVAFPNVDYQAEVFDPSPERALEVARAGDVSPVG